jgi:putative transposase
MACEIPYVRTSTTRNSLDTDRATSSSTDVIDSVKSFGITTMCNAYRSPWQNCVAERFVGNCRRDLLDHVIVLNEYQLKRSMNEYVGCYHEDRTHLGLEKQTQHGRSTAKGSAAGSKVISVLRLGGLHHRYDLAH